MAFLESPRFPDTAAYWAQGGPEYSTDVVEAISGLESRTAKWPIGRCRYTFQGVDFTLVQMAQVTGFFRACKGRFNAFRFKDFADYQVAASSSGFVVSGTIDTTGWMGLPTAALAKLYASSGLTDIRPIKKPVSGTVALLNGVTVLVLGTDYTLDLTTGIVTWTATATRTVTSVSVGVTTAVTLASAIAGPAIGDKLYLSGLTGADAALVNSAAWPITAISGAVYTLNVNTAGKTITPASGTAYTYPGSRASDALTWSGEFDVPVRFDTDILRGSFNTGLWTWQQLALIEVLR